MLTNGSTPPVLRALDELATYTMSSRAHVCELPAPLGAVWAWILPAARVVEGAG